jgi:hypothetical protein
VPLREELRGIGDRIVAHFDAGGDPPFVLYQYDPSAEWRVRGELGELKRWLEAQPRRVSVAAISLARLFWDALDGSGYFGTLVEAERDADGDPDALRDVYDAVGEILRHTPTLPDRVMTEVASCGERTAVVLYRAGALYPAYRTSTLLDDLRSRLDRPVTLMYPGRLVGDYGLSFMARSEPAYGYRALIVPREVRQ